MLHTKSSSRSYWKLLVLLPIVGVTLALNAETVNDYVYQQPQKKIVKKGKKNATVNMGSQQVTVVEQPKAENTTKPVEVIQTKEVFTPVEQMPEFFDVVEQMPEYPGGMQELFSYLSKNIHYPKDAEEQQLQGRVIATFVVMKDGSISNAKVVKSVSPSLDEEALRCINGMPNWIPGKQKGQAVNVKYTIPISFRLDKAKEAPKAETNSVATKDVISRLPGAKIDENGKVTINGKAVKKVLVDGKEISIQDE
jgi:TonB family protein